MMKKIRELLNKSPINYFSDLFIVAMVVMWVIAIIVMMVFAIYSTLVWADNSIWSDLGTLVGLPLSCGGAIWMIKNGVQHAIANKDGRQAHMDFPAVNEDVYGMEKEEPFTPDEESDSAEGTETDWYTTAVETADD